MSPWKIWANDFHDFDNYLKNLDTKEETKDGWVPDTTLFLSQHIKTLLIPSLLHSSNAKPIIAVA